MRALPLFHELTTEILLGRELIVRVATKSDVSLTVRPIQGERLEVMKLEPVRLTAALPGTFAGYDSDAIRGARSVTWPQDLPGGR